LTNNLVFAIFDRVDIDLNLIVAYDRGKVYEKALADIEEHKLFFIEDVLSYCGCSKPTFYDFFKVGSNELNTIKEALDKNKTEVKVSMRSKWYKSDNPTLQVALMKIIASDEEAHRLNGTKVETSGSQTVYHIEVSKEEAKAIAESLKEEYQ
jgi:hypothetical protein